MPRTDVVIKTSHRGFGSTGSVRIPASGTKLNRPPVKKVPAPRAPFDAANDLLVIVPPEEGWIYQVADYCAKTRPYPRSKYNQGLIRDFADAVYSYCKMVCKQTGWAANPIKQLVLNRLILRVDEVKIAISEMGRELEALQNKAKRYHWPAKVFLSHLKNLESKLEWRKRNLDIVFMVNFQRRLSFMKLEIDELEDDIANLWAKSARARTSPSKFAKRLNKCVARRDTLKMRFQELHVKNWKRWLMGQVASIFGEIEARLEQIALTGAHQNDWNVHGYTVMRGRLNEARASHIVLLCYTDEEGVITKIHHVLSAKEYRKRQHSPRKQLLEKSLKKAGDGGARSVGKRQKILREQQKVKSERCYRPKAVWR